MARKRLDSKSRVKALLNSDLLQDENVVSTACRKSKENSGSLLGIEQQRNMQRLLDKKIK